MGQRSLLEGTGRDNPKRAEALLQNVKELQWTDEMEGLTLPSQKELVLAHSRSSQAFRGLLRMDQRLKRQRSTEAAHRKFAF